MTVSQPTTRSRRPAALPEPSPAIFATATVVSEEDVAYRRITAALGGLLASRRDLVRVGPGDLVEGMLPRRADALVVVVLPAKLHTRTALKFLRQEAGKASLVLVIAEVTVSIVRKALDIGVDGIVAEDRIEEALAPTARAVHAGQLAVPRAVLRQVTRPALSPREKQALGMVIMGFTNGEIATKLYLAESTVKTHLSSAFEKLGVRSRHEAAALLLDPDAGLGPGILSIPEAEPAHASHPSTALAPEGRS